MILSAGNIFDSNAVAISEAMGTPESVESFRGEYITPTFEKDSHAGQAIEAAFMTACCDYQRGGFIQGFKAAVQLLSECMPDNITEL